MDKTYKLIMEATVQAVPVTQETAAWAVSWCKGKLNDDKTGILVPCLRTVKLALFDKSHITKNLAGDFDVVDNHRFFHKYHQISNDEGVPGDHHNTSS
jgi:hypothetical protein